MTYYKVQYPNYSNVVQRYTGCKHVQCLIDWYSVLLLLFTEPDWASYKLGVFVCVNCSGTHRDLPAISQIKSIRLDFWDDSLVEVQFNMSPWPRSVPRTFTPWRMYSQDHSIVTIPLMLSCFNMLIMLLLCYNVPIMFLIVVYEDKG